MYNVYGSQNEFELCRTCHKIIQFAHAQSWAKWPSTTDYRICGRENCPLTMSITLKPSVILLLFRVTLGHVPSHVTMPVTCIRDENTVKTLI